MFHLILIVSFIVSLTNVSLAVSVDSAPEAQKIQQGRRTGVAFWIQVKGWRHKIWIPPVSAPMASACDRMNDMSIRSCSRRGQNLLLHSRNNGP